MILRCTQKVLQLIGKRNVTLADGPATDDDWYANLLWFDGRKCLLLAHAGTLFSTFIADVRAADLRPIGPLIVQHIEAELRAERLPPDTLGPLDPDDVHLAKTASRQVLGFMNDMAMHCDAAIANDGGLARSDIGALNHQLRDVPHYRDGYRTALNLVAERTQTASLDRERARR